MAPFKFHFISLLFFFVDSGAETLSGICDTGDKVDDERNLKGKFNFALHVNVEPGATMMTSLAVNQRAGRVA